ncbi:MAG: hypothetical protein IJZ29_00450 [Clostridia bacterium]|nr:hypothetical protein [Clostridia bacterium]
MEEKKCGIFGHREIEITEELEKKVENTFIDLIENKNFTTFYFGGFGDFDELSYQIITKLKEKYSHIRRIYVVENENYITNIRKRPKWLREEDYEEIIYLSLHFDYWAKRIYYRNIAIVDECDFIIFYVNDQSGSGRYRGTGGSGSLKIMNYAKQKKKAFVNLGTITI